MTFDPEMPPPYTVERLAERWECSPNQVRKVIDQGRLAHFRIGILIRIPQAAVEEFEQPNTTAEIPAQSIARRAAVSAPRDIPRKKPVRQMEIGNVVAPTERSKKP